MTETKTNLETKVEMGPDIEAGLKNGQNGLKTGHGLKDQMNGMNGLNGTKFVSGKNGINGKFRAHLGKDQNSNEKAQDQVESGNGEKVPIVQRLGNFFSFLIFQIQWVKLIFEIGLAISFCYIAPISIYRFFAEFGTPSWWTMVFTWTWAFTLTTFGGIGLSVGAHRLWSHHAFKAKWPLKLLLTLMYTLAAENSVYHYVKHHRAHHKYLDTNGDPQNINRGFWYAQLGYRILKLHPEYREKVKTISYDDILQDPFVMFQHKYYIPMVIVVAFIFPVTVPVLIWNESLLNSFLIAGASKSFLVIHMHGLVGSVCHTIGKRPYNKKISATDNGIVQLITAGEAYHNFHHTFPYDYSISELGKTFNTSKMFIDFMAWIGLAYDLRLAGEEFIKKTKQKANEDNPICYTWI